MRRKWRSTVHLFECYAYWHLKWESVPHENAVFPCLEVTLLKLRTDFTPWTHLFAPSLWFCWTWTESKRGKTEEVKRANYSVHPSFPYPERVSTGARPIPHAAQRNTWPSIIITPTCAICTTVTTSNISYSVTPGLYGTACVRCICRSERRRERRNMSRRKQAKPQHLRSDEEGAPSDKGPDNGMPIAGLLIYARV